MLITDAERWQHCMQHGFPVRNQSPEYLHDRQTGARLPQICWTAYGPNNIRGEGHTAQDAVDHAIILTRAA